MKNALAIAVAAGIVSLPAAVQAKSTNFSIYKSHAAEATVQKNTAKTKPAKSRIRPVGSSTGKRNFIYRPAPVRGFGVDLNVSDG